MRRPRCVLSAVSGLALAGLLAGCGGGDPAPDAAGEAEHEQLAVAAAGAEAGDEVEGVAPEDVAVEDAEPQGAVPEDAEPEDDRTFDVSVPPAPDPDMDEADYPDDPFAFERGRYEGLYGRTDFYDPQGVAQPGTMAGHRAMEAYRAGFALGLAQAQARDEDRAATQEAGSAQEPDTPVGQLLNGWDAYSAAVTYWKLDDPLSCSEVGPELPCLDTWYTVGNRSIVVVARVDPSAGPELRDALELRSQVLGYEVLQAWTADDDTEATLPDWARDG